MTNHSKILRKLRTLGRGDLRSFQDHYHDNMIINASLCTKDFPLMTNYVIRIPGSLVITSSIQDRSVVVVVMTHIIYLS